MQSFKNSSEFLHEIDKETNMRRPLIAGNWKMNKTLTEAIEFALALQDRLSDVVGVDVLLCVPFTFQNSISKILKDSLIEIGGQNLYWEEKGAFTGEISGLMLESVGCNFVIAGHSERRHIFGETNEEVNKKIKAALKSYLTPIFCVGETLEERESEKTEDILEEQVTLGLNGVSEEGILKTVIAYEPVWAIGTGRNATPSQANEAHIFIRGLLKNLYNEEVSERIRILYGGSVNPDNIKDLMKEPNIDGVLVGGASLNVDSFEKIVKHYE